MKIRSGFVANSSSSAFLIALPRAPKSAEELQKIIFGNKKFWNGPYGGKHSTSHTSAVLFEVLKDIGKASKKQIQEFFEQDDKGPSFDMAWDKPDNMSWDDWRDSKEYKDGLKKYDKEMKAYVNSKTKEFYTKHKGMSFFIFEIGDGGGSGNITDGDMENGNIWKSISTIKVSHH